jgi:tetratricopeptide (TPR) repeat protein
VWRTEETLWRDVTLRSPRNGRGLMNYSLTQLAIGRTDLALTYFLRAAVFNPSYYVLEINTAIAYSVLGYTAEAEKHFTRATRKNPTFSGAECWSSAQNTIHCCPRTRVP